MQGRDLMAIGKYKDVYGKAFEHDWMAKLAPSNIKLL